MLMLFVDCVKCRCEEMVNVWNQSSVKWGEDWFTSTKTFFIFQWKDGQMVPCYVAVDMKRTFVLNFLALQL